MNQAEFKVLVASLASQYADACDAEIAALRQESRAAYDLLSSKVAILITAYAAGEISGKNAEIRSLQTDGALLGAGEHAALTGLYEGLVAARKEATMVRIGVEHEWKTWRAWLASQGGNG